MAHAIAICSSIEAEKIQIKTRQFNPSPPIMDATTRQMRWNFQLGINSSAWIVHEYSSKASVVFETSMVANEDKITGGCIDGWSRRPLGKPNVEKGSGTHSAEFLVVKGGCYAHIQTPERAHLNSPAMTSKIAAVPQRLNKPDAAPSLEAAGTTGTE
jgi:hypothetical protein